MKVADPYPVIDPRGGFTPIVNVTFHEVERRISGRNLDDPQPPGYAYRLPIAKEYSPWVANRDLVVPIGAYRPWTWGVSSLLNTPIQQGISYYEDGLWHHVGGSVYCWCGDPLTPGGRVTRGGSWRSSKGAVRAAYLDGCDPGFSLCDIGYRLVRGPLA